jgi:SAM-dependent methyltransferase
MTANQPGKSRDLSRTDERVHVYRAQWSFERLASMIREGDRVLSLGAGDCRLDQRLARDHQCDVVSLDVDDYNETDLPLLLYDGLHIPFPDESFDVVLLIFALHHADDPAAVLREARRVCRRHVIAFEDVVITLADKLIFRGFHRFLKRSQGFPLPQREWPPERWSALAREIGFTEQAQKDIGRTFGYLASRHIAFVWEKTELPGHPR